MVATAPCTTSIRTINRKNRISAVEQPKKPQIILRAEASRNVSTTRPDVCSATRLFSTDGPHKHSFQRVPNLTPAHGIDAVRWFVEHKQFRLVDKRLRQTYALQHSLGVLAKPRIAPCR